MGSNLHRLSENAKFKKLGIDIKGLMTRKFAKIPILGQPVHISITTYDNKDREDFFETLIKTKERY